MNIIEWKRPMAIALVSGLLTVAVTACAPDAAEQVSEPMSNTQSLAGATWWVEDIAGNGVVDKSHTTIEFTDDGRVVGDTGCNRYSGKVDISESNITFGPLAGTRKMCPPALMDQERKFFQAMTGVSTWEIAETGLLHLKDATGATRVRAGKTEAR